MRIAPVILAAALLGGCGVHFGDPPKPEVKLVTVTADPPPVVLPAECYSDPRPFPTIPMDKGDRGASVEAVVGTLQRARSAHRETSADKLVCRAAIRERFPEASPKAGG